MIATIYSVSSKPIIVTHEYSLLFNVIFVAFVLPLIASTLQALMDYATFKKLCKLTICSYVIMSAIVFLVIFSQAGALYDRRIDMKTEMK